MTIEEIISSRSELAKEKPENYVQHTNPDGSLGGWRHKTATLGSDVSIGTGSIVLEGAKMGDFSMIGRGSVMGENSVIGNDMFLREGQSLPPGTRLAPTRGSIAASQGGIRRSGGTPTTRRIRAEDKNKGR